MQVIEATKNLAERIADVMVVANNIDKEKALSRVNSCIGKDERNILVAVENSIPYGYVALKVLGDDEPVKKILKDEIDYLGQIMWLGVVPSHQRRGIGKALLEKSEEWQRRKGRKGVWLGCREKLVSFYEHSGYSLAGKYQEDDKTRIIMKKIIQ